MNIPIPNAPLAELHRKLEAKAGGSHAPDVRYRLLDTPLGQLLLASTERGLVRIAFEREGTDIVLQSLSEKISPRILQTPGQLDPAAYWLDAYFSGRHPQEALPLDLRLAQGYRLEVLRHLRDVAYGQRISYQHLAAETSSPRAVRAVGSACATNPLPLAIPCHRVVKSDGGLGAYLGGADAKRRLLALETEGSLPN